MHAWLVWSVWFRPGFASSSAPGLLVLVYYAKYPFDLQIPRLHFSEIALCTVLYCILDLSTFALHLYNADDITTSNKLIHILTKCKNRIIRFKFTHTLVLYVIETTPLQG